MLKDIELHCVYDSSENSLVEDLIIPLLRNSTDYLRGVGYFTSGWLRVAAYGLVGLIENGGKGRLVVSPHFTSEDLNALELGNIAKEDEAVKNALSRSLIDIRESLENDTLNALAWLVADGLLEFRFAIPRPGWEGGDYHDKVGIFSDSRDVVAIHGSFNDSIKGTLNGEAFSVFRLWEEGQSSYVERHRVRLESLWDGKNAQFRVVDIPGAIREQLIQLRTTTNAPYRVRVQVKVAPPDNEKLTCPVTLREYQDKAYKMWHDNGCHGILAMATGTGKTYTALASFQMLHKERGRLFVILLVPYLHLIDQWLQHCNDFGLHPVLCSGSHPDWQRELRRKIQEYRLGVCDHGCALAVHNTASGEDFRRICGTLPHSETMLIADEVHGLGAEKFRAGLLENVGARMGLSATPHRWLDLVGTERLMGYFKGVCYEYSLEEAIGLHLTPYMYNPVLVPFRDDEFQEYEQLSIRIARISVDVRKGKRGKSDLEQLLIQRGRLVSNAAGKLPRLLEHLRRVKGDGCGEEIRGILVYAAPGAHREVLSSLAQLGLRVHEFVHHVSLRERKDVLNHFSSNNIQALVAVKCLDEGVDVPSTRSAYLLASTTNPREFIQRRGRVLRKYPGKSEALIYDFIVVPPAGLDHDRSQTSVGLLKREMARFAEFSYAAKNKYEARSVVLDILRKFDLEYLVDERPTDAYKALSQSGFDDTNESE